MSYKNLLSLLTKKNKIIAFEKAISLEKTEKKLQENTTKGFHVMLLKKKGGGGISNSSL